MTSGGDLDLGGLDPVSARLVGLVLRIVGGDFTARGEVSGSGDGVDAVIVALNMLAESFQQEHEARARAEVLLADAVDTYDLAPDAFCSLEVGALAIVKCNATLARILGVPQATLHGRPFLDMVKPASRTAVAQALEVLVATGTLPHVDVELASADSTTVASMTGAVKRGADAQPIRLLLALRDETENRRLTTQLIQAQRLDALGRLAGGIAHDFNNLLTVIMASAALLAGRLGDRPRDLDELDLVRSTAERAALLVRDLMSFARQETITVTRVAVDEVVEGARTMLTRLAGPEIELVVAPGAPLAETLVGPAQLGQAIVNLVVNARDAMPTGGRITIATRRIVIEDEPDTAPGGYIELAVTDTGAGIPADVQARMFEPFFTTKAVGRGTGLGLSIVYGVVRQAHGYVRVSSSPGQGTTFTLLFPMVGAARPSAIIPPPSPAPQVMLLVVEDDDLVRALTARILRKAGFHVLEANRGDVALALLRDHLDEVALVVSDVVMPGADGVETLTAMRAMRPTLACLFVTGYAREEDRIRAMPGVGLLQKPFVPDTLVSKIREMLAVEAS